MIYFYSHLHLFKRNLPEHSVHKFADYLLYIKIRKAKCVIIPNYLSKIIFQTAFTDS